jgi:hypothetical protein
MIIYSINQYIQNDATLLSLAGKASITISPMIGYDEDSAPVIVYQYSPDIKSEEMYYMHRDTVWFTILDTDIARGFAIRDRIISLLNHGDRIQTKPIAGTYGRLLYMNLYRSADRRPVNPEGYYEISSLFEFCWIPVD